VLGVDNWDAARRSYEGWPWRNTVIEASNALRLFLHNRHLNEYCEWRKIREEVNKSLERIVHPRTTEFSRENALGERFIDCVDWDIGMVLQESGYLKFRAPPFFTRVILSVYEDGHFPCGWDGNWPDGRLVAI
jgi:hypothetical protein